MVLWALIKLKDSLEMNWKQFGRYWVIYLLAFTGNLVHQQYSTVAIVIWATAGYLMSHWSRNKE